MRAKSILIVQLGSTRSHKFHFKLEDDVSSLDTNLIAESISAENCLREHKIIILREETRPRQHYTQEILRNASEMTSGILTPYKEAPALNVSLKARAAKVV